MSGDTIPSGPATEEGITSAQVPEWLPVFVGEDGIVELRALKVPQRFGNPKTEFGFYDREHLGEMADTAIELTNRGASGVYLTLNSVNPDLLARSINRIRIAESGSTTSDGDIVRRRLLLIDADPKRVGGVSSTDAEKAQAWRVINEVRAYLTEQGWPAPIVADSGNGYHLLYRIDLPTADNEAVKRVLTSLSLRFSDDSVAIDPAVFNPSRICKFYGTFSRKGDHLPGVRPHRRSRVLHIPSVLEIVPAPLLEAGATIDQEVSQADRGVIRDEIVLASSAPNRSRRSQIQNAQLFERVRNYLRNVPPAISGQGGHNHTFYVACRLVVGFDLDEDEAYSLLADWNRTCQPPWTDAELRHKVQDAARQPREHGLLLRTPDINWTSGRDNVPDLQPSAAQRQFNLELVSSSDFATADFHQRFLVRGVLVEGQPCIIGGPKKSLKTGTLIEIAVSLGSGTPFLGRPEFAVPEAVNVAVLSGESGMHTLQETARRIAIAHGVELGSCRVWWCDRLPQIANSAHLAELARAIRALQLKVCIIDPAYLCLLSGDTRGRQAANMFDMGTLLLDLSDVAREAGCSLVLAHHTRKNPTDKFAVPELEDLAYAGFAEFARQWILLNRRSAYVPGTGHHELWLSIGGSAGHSSTWAYTVDEGVPDDEFRGRRWSVSVTSASNAIEHSRAERAARKDQEVRDRNRVNADQIVLLLRSVTEPLTKNEIRDRLGLSGTVLNAALAEVLGRGVTQQTAKRQGNGQSYPAYQISSGPVGCPSGLSGCPDAPANTLGQGAM